MVVVAELCQVIPRHRVIHYVYVCLCEVVVAELCKSTADCFFLASEDFGERFDDSVPPCAFFFPLRLRWVKDVCVFMCNLPPALLAE